MTGDKPKRRGGRIRRLLVPQAYRTWALVIILGVTISAFAWTSADLLKVAMANTRFLREFGVVAIEHGGLLQLFEILIKGSVALFLWIVFRVCEAELIRRWLRAGLDEDFNE